MKSRIIISAALVTIVAALCVGEVFAAGRGNGGASRGTCATGTGTSTAIRPTDSTANGSTTRPSNGRGLQDGSRLTTTAQ